MSTPNPKALYCIALSAEDILKGFIEVSKSWGTEGQINLSLTTNIDGLQCSSIIPESNQEAAFQDFLTKVSGKPTIICHSASLQLRLPAHNQSQQWQNSQISYKTDNGSIGEFTINLKNCPDDIPAVLQAVEDNFPVTNYLDLARSESPSIDDVALQLRERSVSDLKEQVSKLAEFLTGMAEREARSREEIQTKLDQAHQERADKLNEEYRAHKEAFDQVKANEEAKLDSQRKDLAAKREELDLRDEQGVRRELLEKIQTVLKDAEKHNASDDTQKKRQIIHKITYGLFGLGSIIAIISGIKIFGAGEPDWHFWVVFASSITTIITTAIYYLKWNDRWFREHADAEFAAKRYKADILRASWLAELAGEWQKTKDKKELSPLLVEAFTRNLFADVSIGDPSDHPLDEMSNLLKRASEVSFGKTGFSMKGIKSLTKSDTRQ